MMRVISSLFWLLVLCTGALAQFSNFTAIPTHPTPGIALAWIGPGGIITINRWVDGGLPSPIATTTGATYTDTTGAANTLYYYSVSQGAASSTTAQAVVSDLTQPFVCPFVQPIDSNLIGVDRTVSFQSANGTPISFTIHAPVTTSTVTIPPCNGAGGCDDRTNINAIAANGVKAQLTTGDYFWNIPNAGTPFGLNYNLFSDMTVAGVRSGVQPPTSATDTIIHINLPPNGDSPYWVAVPGIAARNMMRDVVLSGDFVNAIPGTVTTSGGNQILTIGSNPTWYVPDGANPPVMFSSTGYNLTNGTYTIATGGRPGIPATFNTNWAVDHLYYYTFTGINFPNPQGAIGWVKHSATAPAIPRPIFNIADISDFTIANVDIYNASGGLIQMVDIGSTNAGGLWIVNSKIGKKPASLLRPGEPPGVIAGFGDSDVNSTTGRILIENNDFGFIDDDVFAFQGGFAKQAVSIVSTSEATFTAVINHALNANDVFNFYDPQTLSLLGSATALSWTQVAGTLDVTFATPIPGLAPYVGLSPPATPFATEPLYGNPNIVVRNNCFHDTYGHLAFLSASNGLIQNNTYGNGGPQSISLSWFPKGQPSVGVQNMIIDANRIVGSAYSQLDTNWLGNSTFGLQTGAPSSAIVLNTIAWPVAPSTTSLVPVQLTGSAFQGYGVRSLEIKNNFISNVPGLGILVNGTNNVGMVNNTIVDANAVAYTAGYNVSFCGATSVGIPIVTTPICENYVAAQKALMSSHASNVDTSSTPNIFLGTSVNPGIFIDTPTVLYNNIVGSRFVH